ncbi:MAG TPA: DUF2225 domain-containing protein [Pyrinomonadaceae bacterium]
MRQTLSRSALAAALVLALCGAHAPAHPAHAPAHPPHALAITWFPQEFECPVCRTKNVFLVVGSYGSYIYQYESKFQLIFWPYTDSPTVYSCKKCRLSAFMGDFEQTPKEKHAEILKRLEGVKLEPRKDGESATKYYKDAVYLDIPLSERLLAAQRVYEVMGRDDEFWCHFQRVLGHRYEAEGKRPEADAARREALRLAEKLLGDRGRAGERKEFLYISGAMRHFLKDDAGALKAFREAMPLKYENKELDKEKNGNYDEFLSDLLRQYVEKIERPAPKEKPKAD